MFLRLENCKSMGSQLHLIFIKINTTTRSIKLKLVRSVRIKIGKILEQFGFIFF